MVIGETVWVPVEAAEIDQPPAFCFGVGHELLVGYIDHVHRQNLAPVLHQSLVLAIVEAKVGKIVSEFLAPVEELEIARKAGVKRIAPAMDHPSLGEDQRDEGKPQEIVRHLVGDPRGPGRQALQEISQPFAEAAAVRPVHALDRSGKGRLILKVQGKAGDHLADFLTFAAAEDTGVAD